MPDEEDAVVGILRRGGRISEVLRVTAEAYERREQRANAAKTMLELPNDCNRPVQSSKKGFASW